MLRDETPALGLAIGAVEVDRRRRIRSGPRSIIAGIDPQPPGLGAAAAGIEHRHRRIVGKELAATRRHAQQPLVQRLQPPAGAAHPVRQGRALNLDPMAGEDLRLAIERSVIAILADQTWASRPGVAMPLAIGRSGAGA